MNSLRESLSHVHGYINPSLWNPSSSSTPSSTHSGDDGAGSSDGTANTSSQDQKSSIDRSKIPISLIKEQWDLVLGQDATISDLELAIGRCKELVIQTEEFSEERKWLVRNLVELRFQLSEIRDAADDPNAEKPSGKTVLGHHFIVRSGRPVSVSNVREYCDHCTGTIWSVVQSSYACLDCGFIVHHKCIDNIIRICAHVIASEKKFPIQEICPEVGLAAQSYECSECKVALNFKGSSWIEPRLCDYCGLFFCPTCHWNNVSIIPARIILNWDFSQRKACRASLQEINLLLDKPVINLEEINPKLFVFLDKLSNIKKLRKNLVYMRKYLSECRKATDLKIIDHQIGSRRYLIQATDYYSISDLIQLESGVLTEFLSKIFATFEKHIRNCDICSGKGYICEICNEDEVLFPFDDGSVPCNQNCNSLYHKVCWVTKNMQCPKCIRLEERKVQKEKDSQDANDVK